MSTYRDLVIFFVFAFGLSWAAWIPVVLSTRGFAAEAVPAVVAIPVGTFGPFAAAALVVARRSGAQGLRQFVRDLLRWRVGTIWYAIALFGPAAVMLAALSLAAMTGDRSPALPEVSDLPLVVLNFLFVVVLGGPLGEEPGWRGYALPRLQVRLGTLRAALVLGVIWTFWHAPLFFVPGLPQEQLPFSLFLVQNVALSVVFAYAYNHTGGSVPIAVLLHASINTWVGVLPVLPEASGGLLVFVLTVLIACAVAALLSWYGWVRGGRAEGSR